LIKGPEFGGAIGLMFTLANSIAVSMYLIGFVEALLDMLEQYVNGFTSILHAGKLQVSFKQFLFHLTITVEGA
jgi:hypothetical protein